jgi:hypothetical protein
MGPDIDGSKMRLGAERLRRASLLSGDERARNG